MRLILIQVECYAGAKAGEMPCRFVLEERTVEVGEILDRWSEVESQPTWPQADYFKVRGADLREYLLKHDLESNEWYWGARFV